MHTEECGFAGDDAHHVHTMTEGWAMAIQIFCTACKTSSALTAKKCSKCGVSFTRDKKYRVCVSVKGQRVTRVCDNLTIARETETAIKTDMLREEFDITVHQKKKVVTLGDVWAKYLPWAKEHKKTWDDDQYHYHKHLKPRFGGKALKDITPFEIEKMKMELKKGLNAHGKPYAAASIKHQMVLLRRLFNVARKWEMHEGGNPVERVQMPKVDNQKTEFLTEEELNRLMETLDNWPFKESVAFIKFALFTGLRRGELFKLTWDDVDFERSMVTLREPKGGKTTTIPISQAAIDIIRPLQVTSTFVFPGDDGKQRTDFKGPWQRIRKAAGLPDDFRFQGLRHHFASTLVSNGVDLGIVRELLTHKHVGTTERYAHFAPAAVRDAANKAGELLQPRRQEDRRKIVSINE
jgi:integrase/ribosomal protein L40E